MCLQFRMLSPFSIIYNAGIEQMFELLQKLRAPEVTVPPVKLV